MSGFLKCQIGLCPGLIMQLRRRLHQAWPTAIEKRAKLIGRCTPDRCSPACSSPETAASIVGITTRALSLGKPIYTLHPAVRRLALHQALVSRRDQSI